MKLGGGVHFNGPVPLRLPLFSAGGYFSGFIAADPGVDLHSVPDFAPQHLMHTQTVPSAFEIPKRLIYPRQGTHQHRSTSIKPSTVKHLPEVFDLIGISSEYVMAKFGHRSGHSVRAAFNDRFAPSS